VPFLAEVADTIHQELTAGHCLLVHDRGGRTRSCTAVAAYYVKLGWQPKKALRKAAKVVPSFRESIKAYQLDRKIQQLFEHYYPEAAPPEGFLTRFLNKLRFG
jgi:protein-tyrosine phosphatase